MNLLIDIGNSMVKIALANGDTLQPELHTSYEDIVPFLNRLLVKHPSIKRAIISSVGKPVEKSIKDLLNGKQIPTILFDAETPIPIKNNYATKSTLGSDRLAAAIGAWALYPGQNTLSIDCGTALTYEMVTAQGVYLGGNIAPGMQMRFKALHEFSARLPLVEADSDFSFYGKTTQEAIRAGVINGIIFEIERYIDETSNKYPDLKVILTGGDAFFFVKQLKKTIFVVSNLILVGLNRILEYND
ncbi:MAG: type III pantothenate kinase [Bacteroidota bacterium]